MISSAYDEISFALRFPTHGDNLLAFIACSNGSHIPFPNVPEPGLLQCHVSRQFSVF